MADSDTFQKFSAVELVVHCANENNQRAWQEFVRRFQTHICHFAQRELRAQHLAQDSEMVRDTMQEIYLRLLANDRNALKSFRGDNEFRLLAYLAIIVKNVITDLTRKELTKKRAANMVSLDESLTGKQTNLTIADTLPASNEVSPDYILIENLTPNNLKKLLSKVLSGANIKRDAMIFQLHVLDGLTSKEIASLPALNMTEVGVMAVIHRTKEKLRELMISSSDHYL